LKSALVLRGVDFPRSHALERLVALLPADIRARFDEESLAALTPWAIAGRYPEDIAPPDEDTINSIVTLSREIVATAESISG
jgi:HEPN domain-containing protein